MLRDTIASVPGGRVCVITLPRVTVRGRRPTVVPRHHLSQTVGLGTQRCHDKHHKILSFPWLAKTAAPATTVAPTAGIPANDSAISAKTAR